MQEEKTQRLLAQLQQLRQSGQALYLAIDATHRTPDLDELEFARQVASQGLVVPLKHPEIDPAKQPCWTNAASAPPSLLARSVELALAETMPDALIQGHGRRIAGWLELETPAKQAAAHIGRQMIRRDAAGETVLLRLHDPSVLWALWPVLSPLQQRWLFRGIRRWWLLDPAGELACLEPPQTAQSAPAEAAAIWSAEQWQRIADIGAFNRALLDWAQQRPLPDGEDLLAARAEAFSALRQARALGFIDEQDLALFALHALSVHPRFYRHPKIQARLTRRQADDFYSGLVDELSEADWQNIAAETA
ncbi:DUF4123 domain-containing protein [Chromobacterium violaceum]|uniref:DUF4123 domain-containing protein n=1 Tax=Chromobacterium violaceum TaxID=536 RepID=UPI001B31DF30|nr:DUF4123 domain-containing protein [Chromobacterium violaceum]MBP4044046.1 DUF4123 domain-containing protein [Chromobacterium violaceum]